MTLIFRLGTSFRPSAGRRFAPKLEPTVTNACFKKNKVKKVLKILELHYFMILASVICTKKKNKRFELINLTKSIRSVGTEHFKVVLDEEFSRKKG